MITGIYRHLKIYQTLTNKKINNIFYFDGERMQTVYAFLPIKIMQIIVIYSSCFSRPIINNIVY